MFAAPATFGSGSAPRTDRAKAVIGIAAPAGYTAPVRGSRTSTARTPERCAAFGIVGLDWQQYVEIDPRYLRPTEVDELCGDASKARDVLGWHARTTFDALVRLMVEADLREAGLDPAKHMPTVDVLAEAG